MLDYETGYNILENNTDPPPELEPHPETTKQQLPPPALPLGIS